MKKLFAALFSMLFMITLLTAQSGDVFNGNATDADYERYVDQRMKVDYRKTTTQALGLTEEERKEFDPIFEKYMGKKEKSLKKRMELLEELREELAENDSEKNEAEDRADFIEDYWELTIKEMDLKKEYFDNLEDKIPVHKATSFFLWDETVDRRMTNNLLGEIMPAVSMDIDSKRAWKKSTNQTARKITTTMNTSAMGEDADDYQRYIDSKMEMEFRNAALKTLNLTSEEIVKFDPLFRRYMTKKENILEDRLYLLGDFASEMLEDDSRENQAEDGADFLEDYWELEIADMELKKRYFDKMEDKMQVEKALQFFLFEDAVENRIMMNLMRDMMPTFVDMDNLLYIPNSTSIKLPSNPPVTTTTTTKPATTTRLTLSAGTTQLIESFNTWVIGNRDKVSLSHDYTSDGLKALANTLDAVQRDLKLNIPNFSTQQSTIRQNASAM